MRPAPRAGKKSALPEGGAGNGKGRVRDPPLQLRLHGNGAVLLFIPLQVVLHRHAQLHIDRPSALLGQCTDLLHVLLFQPQRIRIRLNGHRTHSK